MNDEEIDFVNQNPCDEKFYVYWCAKESLFKLNGKKHLSFRDDISLYPFEYQQKGVVRAKINSEGGIKEFDVQYEEFNGYMFTYVIEGI